jgi:hypothetical protein
MTISKLYASRSAGGDGKRSYGLGLKLKMIEVKPVEGSSDDSEIGFIDSDVEEEKEIKQLVTETSKKEDDALKPKGRKNAKNTV